MAVPKHKIIDCFLRLITLGETHEVLVLFALISGRIIQLFLPAMLRPPIAEGIAYTRRQERKKCLRHRVMEELTQAQKRLIGRKLIPVSHEDTAVIEGRLVGLAMDNHTRLTLQPAECPYIVITGEVMHLYPLIRQAFEGIQHGSECSAFRALGPDIFVPEVEHIAQEEDMGCVLAHEVEQVDEALLVLSGIRYHARTYMCITEEVYHSFNNIAV